MTGQITPIMPGASLNGQATPTSIFYTIKNLLLHIYAFLLTDRKIDRQTKKRTSSWSNNHADTLEVRN